jgi:hypothetical protein
VGHAKVTIDLPGLSHGRICADMTAIPCTIPSPIPLHLGALHPFEQALVFGLAFGPFVVLALVIYIVRRHDLAAEEHTPSE